MSYIGVITYHRKLVLFLPYFNLIMCLYLLGGTIYMKIHLYVGYCPFGFFLILMKLVAFVPVGVFLHPVTIFQYNMWIMFTHLFLFCFCQVSTNHIIYTVYVYQFPQEQIFIQLFMSLVLSSVLICSTFLLIHGQFLVGC